MPIRTRLQGRRRRRDRLRFGPGQQARAAGLWPHVPDAVCRPGAQLGRDFDHCGGRHQRGRPRQQHHCRRPRRPVRCRPAAPGESGLDSQRGRAHQPRRPGLAWPGRKPTAPASCSSNAPWRANATWQHKPPARLPPPRQPCALTDCEPTTSMRLKARPRPTPVQTRPPAKGTAARRKRRCRPAMPSAPVQAAASAWPPRSGRRQSAHG